MRNHRLRFANGSHARARAAAAAERMAEARTEEPAEFPKYAHAADAVAAAAADMRAAGVGSAAAGTTRRGRRRAAPEVADVEAVGMNPPELLAEVRQEQPAESPTR